MINVQFDLGDEMTQMAKRLNEFYLDGAKEKVAAGTMSGNVVALKLKEASSAQKITYLKEMSWSQQRLLKGKNGNAALTFCDVPIRSKKYFKSCVDLGAQEEPKTAMDPETLGLLASIGIERASRSSPTREATGCRPVQARAGA